MSTPVIDILARNKARNEAEQAARNAANGVTVPAQPPVIETPAEPLKTGEPGITKVPRSVRRELNKLREEAAEARGQLAAMREMYGDSKKPVGEEKTTAEEKPAGKPVRANFPAGPEGDAEFAEKISEFIVKAETDKSDARRAFEARVRDMENKAFEDAKLIPDFARHAEEAEKTGPEWFPHEHRTLTGLLGTSEYQALALDYFAVHPDELKAMLDLKDKPAEVVAEFRALEGHLKRVYATLRKTAEKSQAQQAGKEGGKPEEKPSHAAAAKLPKPSDSASVKSGSAPGGAVSPFLPDGKTLNPAWKQQRNERERTH